MQTAIQHLYKPPHEGNGLLYAWFLSMHTRVDIILYSQKPERELLLVVNRIYDALYRLEKIANFYDPDSELSFVNRTASISPIVLSEELYSMIDLCLEYNSKTLGYFDITVHSENYTQTTIHSVHLSAEEHSIHFSQPGVSINLSGFLKRRHIISPRNGKLVEGVKQIAVVTTNGAIGEILSTSLFAADSEQREALLAKFSSVLSQFYFIDC